jgi:primosomal protein N' (replication factor Y) (superfamily II helicase)
VAIVRLALPVAAHQLFDYWLPDGLAVQPGSVLRARLGGRRLPAVAVEVVEASQVPPERLVPVDEIVAGIPPLPDDVRALARFVSEYYQEPIGQCFAQALPPLVVARRVPRAPAPLPAAVVPTALNPDQRTAVDAALREAHRFSPSLLQGVTGSGKTEVYLAVAAQVIGAGRQALVLVPEINLTPQLTERIAGTLPGIHTAILHSRLSAGERRAHWLAAANGDAQLVVGTRLAVFAPLPRLGLIIVDEEHDASYKQQEGVRYHARDVAIYRARLREVPVLLGSATPSLETYAQATRGRYRWLTLPRRATAQVALPPVRLVPNRAAGSTEGIGPALRQAMAARLARREQTLLFINRRGFAPSLLCAACGWKAMCPRCSARLVVHRDACRLRCHHCGHEAAMPTACPDCGNQDLLPLGFGTQRLERAVSELYPRARIVRIDRDSTRRKRAFASMRGAIAAGEVDILVGTQMLAKGHDFPRLTLVGVLGADNALYSAEFRATERLFASLEQVAGRAGRGELAGEVLVQTDFPEHPVYAALANHDYNRFAASLLAERKSLGLPPFASLALLVGEAKHAMALNAFLATAAERGRSLAAQGHGCQIFPPVPATLSRRAGLERAQVLAQSRDRRKLQEFLPRWRAELERISQRHVRWSLDVDPLGFA